MRIRTIKRDIKYWFQRRTRGWSDDETWNLDYEFIKWINSRFKKYKELANEMVDLEFYKLNYKNKEYSQLELIDKEIELTDMYLNIYTFVGEEYEKMCDGIKDEVLDIFKILFWYMWW